MIFVIRLTLLALLVPLFLSTFSTIPHTRAAEAGPLRDFLQERRAARSDKNGDGDIDRFDNPSLSQPHNAPEDFITNIPGARVIADLSYGTQARETMDVYLPAQPQNAPVIFMVHGGAWMIGDKTNSHVVEHKVAHYLPLGFIFVSVNYPLVPDVDVLTQADSVRKALSFAQAKAPSWGGAPDKVIVMGHSAGAHLVSLITADPRPALEKFGAQPWRGTISLDSAAYNLTPIMKTPRHFKFYDKVFGTDPELWRAASPLALLGNDVPTYPMLLVCSTKRTESCAQASVFAATAKGRARDKGTDFEVLKQGMTHAEINNLVGVEGAYTDAIDAFIRHALEPRL